MTLDETLASEVRRLTRAHVFKDETPLNSAQDASVRIGHRDVIMLASNNYLGLSNDPRIVDAAIRGLREYGHGVASVRFICGTQTIHRELEQRLAEFLGTEDSILFSSCYAANEAFFASIVNDPLGHEDYKDAIYSDRLNHASIIDGTRLCRADAVDRHVYVHSDIENLEVLLNADRDQGHRFRFIASDGVFSMEGDLARLPELVSLAEKSRSVLFVDDSHGVGVLGATGRGTPEALGVTGRIPVLTGTLGKALGGAAGGYIASSGDVVAYMRQKARPYTFSNSLPPAIVTAALEALRILGNDTTLVSRLAANTRYFRTHIQTLGFEVLEGQHPIVPVMLGSAPRAMEMSRALLDEGVYVKGLWYPVVPEGEARLRVQISAALNQNHMDRALEAFERVGRRMGVI